MNYRESLWTLWTYLWFTGQNELLSALIKRKSSMAPDRDFASAIACVGCALSSEGYIDSTIGKMDEHPIAKSVLAQIGRQSIVQVVMAPYYYAALAMAIVHKESPSHQFITAANDAVKGLYESWNRDELLAELLDAYPDSKAYIDW